MLIVLFTLYSVDLMNATNANLANPTPLLCPAVSRNIRVEITCPY